MFIVMLRVQRSVRIHKFFGRFLTTAFQRIDNFKEKLELISWFYWESADPHKIETQIQIDIGTLWKMQKMLGFFSCHIFSWVRSAFPAIWPSWARICKRLRSPGIDSEDSIPGLLKRLTKTGTVLVFYLPALAVPVLDGCGSWFLWAGRQAGGKPARAADPCGTGFWPGWRLSSSWITWN